MLDGPFNPTKKPADSADVVSAPAEKTAESCPPPSESGDDELGLPPAKVTRLGSFVPESMFRRLEQQLSAMTAERDWLKTEVGVKKRDMAELTAERDAATARAEAAEADCAALVSAVRSWFGGCRIEDAETLQQKQLFELVRAEHPGAALLKELADWKARAERAEASLRAQLSQRM